ncbi:DUF2752 domain-containing protein [Salinibacter altiplanensis]|uniref:DUF2752 domain-containing protein n=1 Tax=Salinibacter altiplanensis TaxID=1803181 RepID=UPI000C9ED25F|nr:DUF2752 domain-containing protein [Salinibacter altiplanensis]
MPTAQDPIGPVIQRLRAVPLEAVFWAAALLAAASIAPKAPGSINLCLIEHLGLPCPGDGLGTAIAHLARGHWAASWNAHPLAGPVVGVLVAHVVSLCRAARRPAR